MNKTTKGAIAAASAVVLLSGGAGSLAYWSSEASLDLGQVSSGRLTIKPSSVAGVWKNGTHTINRIADYRIVPGDTLVYTKAFDLEAEGNNLSANLGLTLPEIDERLARSGVTMEVRVRKDGVGEPIRRVTSADNGSQLVTEVTISMPSTVSGTDAQGLSADLSAMRLNVTQTEPGTSGN